jgi:hypothetical protein
VLQSDTRPVKKENIVILVIAGVIGVGATVLLVLGTRNSGRNLVLVDAQEDAAVELDGAPLSKMHNGHLLVPLGKAGKNTIRVTLADGSTEETTVDSPKKGYYRAVFRVGEPKPLALVSVGYGHCDTYFNSGHALVYEGTRITTPGVVPLPTKKGLLELPGELYLDTVDAPFSETFPVKTNECGWLSTHLCHLDKDGQSACAGADGPHELTER